MKVKFVVVREPSDDVAAVVTAEVSTDVHGIDQFLERLNMALSRWFSETPEGKNEWGASSHDFNIGDLACANYTKGSLLGNLLLEQGIANLSIETLYHDGPAWRYDKVLGLNAGSEVSA